MEKPMKKFIEECLLIGNNKNKSDNSKTAEKLLNAARVYMLLTMRKPLVQDSSFVKHLSSGLGEKGLAKNDSPKGFEDLKLEYIYFNEKGLAYLKVYQKEIVVKGLSWVDFSLNLLTDKNYYDSVAVLLEKPVSAGSKPKRFKMGSASELKNRADKLFKELYSLCGDMESMSNALIYKQDMANGSGQNGISDFMLANHSKYFAGAKSNETELKKQVAKTEQGFTDVLVVLGLVETIYKGGN